MKGFKNDSIGIRKISVRVLIELRELNQSYFFREYVGKNGIYGEKMKNKYILLSGGTIISYVN